MIILPKVELSDDLGQHYNPFRITYKITDNLDGVSVVEKIDGNKIRTMIVNHGNVTSLDIDKMLWRGLDCGNHRFSLDITDQEGNSTHVESMFKKVTMPWYATSKRINIIGSRKPQIELLDLSKCNVKVFSKANISNPHLIQTINKNSTKTIKDRVLNNELLVHKSSKSKIDTLDLINVPYGQVVLSKHCIDTSFIKEIKGLNLNGHGVRIILSFDNGISWNGKFDDNIGDYISIDVTDNIDTLYEHSIVTNDSNSVNIAKLNSLLDNTPITVGYVLRDFNSKINSFGLDVSVNGVFEKANDSDYKIEYLNDTTIRITFSNGGSYKVNYISGELTLSEYDKLSKLVEDVQSSLYDIKTNGVQLTISDVDLACDFVPLRYDASISYDKEGRIIREEFTGDIPKIVEYEYSNDLISKKIVTNEFGIKKCSQFSYDEKGRLIHISDNGTDNSRSAGVIGMPISREVSFKYDVNGRVISEIYTGMENKRVDYEYISTHTKKKKVTYSNGEVRTATYSYDINGNLISITDDGVDKIYTPLNTNAIAKPRCISKSEDSVALINNTVILNVKELKNSNNFNVVMNSEILLKSEYKKEMNSLVTVVIEQDGIQIDTIHLYPQEVQKYQLGCSEGIKVSASGRLSYSYSLSVI